MCKKCKELIAENKQLRAQILRARTNAGRIIDALVDADRLLNEIQDGVCSAGPTDAEVEQEIEAGDLHGVLQPAEPEVERDRRTG